MDHQIFQGIVAVVGVLFTIIGIGIGWWINTIWGMVRAQQSQITNLTVKLAESYMPRSELQDTLNRIFELLEDIRKEVRHA